VKRAAVSGQKTEAGDDAVVADHRRRALRAVVQYPEIDHARVL
jgi:hypothetical protein